MSSTGERALAHDPQARRLAETALQPHKLGASLELDSHGMPQVKPASAVSKLEPGEDEIGVSGAAIVGALVDLGNPAAATLVQTATKVNELVAKVNELVTRLNASTQKQNENVARSNKARRAAEAHASKLHDSLTRGGIMEK